MSKSVEYWYLILLTECLSCMWLDAGGRISMCCSCSCSLPTRSLLITAGREQWIRRTFGLISTAVFMLVRSWVLGPSCSFNDSLSWFFFFLRAVLMIAASDLLELLRRAKCPLNNCLRSSPWIVRDITISIATNGLSRRILYFWNLRGTGRSCCDHDWEHECSAELGELLHAAQ